MALARNKTQTVGCRCVHLGIVLYLLSNCDEDGVLWRKVITQEWRGDTQMVFHWVRGKARKASVQLHLGS